MKLLKFVQRNFALPRRKAFSLILSGKVKVNGEVVRQPMTILRENDVVEVEGLKKVKFLQNVYVAFYKPVGYVVSKSDGFNRTIYEVLPKEFKYLNPVGRLDKNSEGLLILTDDNEMIHRLTHPKYGIRRGYLVKTEPLPNERVVKRFLEGIESRGELLKAESCRILKGSLFVVLSEGKNREIRRMAKACGLKVLKLKRVFYGNIRLDLRPGRWRCLTDDEVKALKSLVKLNQP